MSWVPIVQSANCPGAKCPKRQMSGAKCPGAGWWAPFVSLPKKPPSPCRHLQVFWTLPFPLRTIRDFNILFQDNKENGVEVVNEVGGGDSSEKKDSSEKSDEKWKKNYVPYQEPEEDSNKQ